MCTFFSAKNNQNKNQKTLTTLENISKITKAKRNSSIPALLCGLSGFTEFIEYPLIDTVLNWSNATTGCFHNPFEDYGNDCLNHMTSLGLTYEILLLLSAAKM